MKEPYAKPRMVTEKLEIGALMAIGSPAGEPIAQLEPFFGLCPPCEV
jgi:hypothetical protein